ncbi:efflux RND transporter periplasmic adaptor subunit [uncultured Methylovirgula sp.]|uniref:efflux RND transporter periplasmic adaptor subunit n=1 Tax=uncultured Methylovirgula sp. TaxID=1285960 RepID=UPI00262A22DF|nr:efflux RND transporter periplasmic adaptor subunit [uncultured Methylovirgula sp.]
MHDNVTKSVKTRGRLARKVLWRLLLVAVAAAVLAFFGITSREKQESDLARLTQDEAVPTVDLVNPERGTAAQHLVLPGEVQAWYSAPIYARVSGYVKMWYKDIGAKVKAGDVLAEIDTPDLDQQYEQAKGELAKAKADEALAELTAKRWQAMRATDAVSQQTADEKVGDYNAKKAEVAAAAANVARLQALEGFKKIVAPFDGVVTARKIDVGALVNSTPGNAPDLFDVADVHEMRIYVDVPQAFSAEIHLGMTAELKLPQFPNQLFVAKVATTSDAISQHSRSLLVELRRNNKDGLLQPGAFVEVDFNLPPDPNALRIPASALIFRRTGPEVATVNSDDKVVLKPVVVGRDLGTEVEIKSGLSPQDRLIRSPSDSVADGERVRIAGGTAAGLEPSAH